MEVSETKLVNFAEKTKFDISKVIKAPPIPKPGGRLFFNLNQNKLELISPDLSLLVGPDGVWNGAAPTFRFKDTKTGEIYSGLSEVPRLDESALRDIGSQMTSDFVPSFEAFLGTLTPQNTRTENIFQLDPNQLLSVSEGFKVILHHPLDS